MRWSPGRYSRHHTGGDRERFPPDRVGGECPGGGEEGDSMISELAGLPDGVVGFEASGKIEAGDYRDVVIPALERAFAGGEVRFLIVMTDFQGMDGGALWQDLKVGVEHLRGWKRVAVVTDIEWVHHLTGLFGWMTPGEVRVFPLDQRDEAVSWVAG